MDKVLLYKQFRTIEKHQRLSYFTFEEYCSFVENALETKKDLISRMNNQTRIVLPLEDTQGADLEYKNISCRDIFKKRSREELFGGKVQSITLKLYSILRESKVFENRHSSGKKMTKVILETIGGKEGEDLVLLYSQIKNTFVAPKGFVVISVDPFDFLMMGKGRDWHTCYQPNGGLHYGGTYALSMDPKAITAYITTDENILEGNENKIYRRLGVFKEDLSALRLSTEYPYKNEFMEKAIVESINKLLFDGQATFSQQEKDTFKLYQSPGSQIYNDFVSATAEKISYSTLALDRSVESGITRYGKPFKCIVCHKHASTNDLPICVDCEMNSLEKSWEEHHGEELSEALF